MLRSSLTVLTALAVFFCISTAAPSQLQSEDGNPSTYIFESQIHEVLKNLSEQWAQNDPLLIPELKVDMDTSDLFRVDFEATDVQVIGYSNFYATDLKITVLPPALTFNIQFEQLQVIIPYYYLDGLAVFIPFYGSGSMNLRSSVINVGGSAKVAIGTSGISGIKNIKLKFNLTESDLQITGLIHNEPMSEIVSTATTECFPEFVNTYGNRIGELVGGAIEGVINKKMAPLPKEPQQFDESLGYSDTIEYGETKINYYYKL